eukprot:8009834-Alexandrium_andersonii.AAC.1
MEADLDGEAGVFQEVPQHFPCERRAVAATLALEAQVCEGRVVPVPAPQGLQYAQLHHLVHPAREEEERLARGPSHSVVAVPPQLA